MSAKKDTDSHRVFSPKNPLNWLSLQNPHLPLIILILITAIAYANAWPNNVVLDDVKFAVPERFLALGLTDIYQFFVEDLWAAGGTDSGLYRPLLLVSIMIDAHLFGHWVAGYHLINILLHVMATVLVYGLIRHLGILSGAGLELSSRVAILAALIFGVHPIHTEVVNSIFNRSEILVTIGVTGGLWWFLRSVEIKPGKAWFGLSLVYLLIMLCRESGAVFPALVVTLLWFTSNGNWLRRTRKCLPVFFLLIPLLIYLGLRANALHAPEYDYQVASIDQSAVVNEVDDADLAEEIDEADEEDTISDESTDAKVGLFNDFQSFRFRKLKNLTRLGADSLRMMVWPHPLLIYHDRPKTGHRNGLLLFLTLLSVAAFAYVKNSSELIVGLVFFYLALMPSSRIIGAAWESPVLAERYLYLPSVGLAIALVFGLRWLVRRFNMRAAVELTLVVLFVFMPMTWTRNAEWASNLLLDEAEYRRGRQSRILSALVVDNLAAKNYIRAVEICDEHSDNLKGNYRCGKAFESVGRFDDAEQTYFQAMGNRFALGMIHHALAGLYLRQGRKSDAKRHYEKAIEAEKKPFLKELRTAVMLLDLYPVDQARLLEAKKHAERAISMQPQSDQARLILRQIENRLRRRSGP